jgi:hypothetical protein
MTRHDFNSVRWPESPRRWRAERHHGHRLRQTGEGQRTTLNVVESAPAVRRTSGLSNELCNRVHSAASRHASDLVDIDLRHFMDRRRPLEYTSDDPSETLAGIGSI